MHKKKIFGNVLFCFALAVWLLNSFWRLEKEYQHRVVSRFDKKTIVGSHWDPRNFNQVVEITRKRESQAFRDRLRRGLTQPFIWPGLQAAQATWTWLEITQGLHNESSYEGDFSWMFSKLYSIVVLTHPEEIRFLTSLAPFFLVIGKDHIGASVLMQEIIERAPQEFNTWFHSGYHAIENLGDRQLASDYILKASQFPYSPPYLKALHVRLKLGQEFLSAVEKKQMIENEIKDPELLDVVKKLRPEWFE
jgi:hypothetical protein